MKRIIGLLLAIAILTSLTAGAPAETEHIRFPATMVKALYNKESNGVQGFMLNEETRALVTICAFLDWQSYDSDADFLLSYSYIGKDTEGEILWVGLGGSKTSIILMYAPENSPDYITGIPFEFSGEWIPSFIDLYCDPLYRNDKDVIMRVVNNLGSK